MREVDNIIAEGNLPTGTTFAHIDIPNCSSDKIRIEFNGVTHDNATATKAQIVLGADVANTHGVRFRTGATESDILVSSVAVFNGTACNFFIEYPNNRKVTNSLTPPNTQTTPGTRVWFANNFRNGLLLVGGYNGTTASQMIYSLDGGVTFTAIATATVTSSTGTAWKKIMYVEQLSKYFAYGNIGLIGSSTDGGFTWTTSVNTSSPTHATCVDCVYASDIAGGRFFLLGYPTSSGISISYSSDGITFTGTHAPVASNSSFIATGNGIVVIANILIPGTTGFTKSTSGTSGTWSAPTTNITFGTLLGFKFYNGYFYCIHAGGGVYNIVRSTDCVTWTSLATISGYTYHGTAYGDMSNGFNITTVNGDMIMSFIGYFYTGSAYDPVQFYSYDGGITWINRAYSTAYDFMYALTYGNSRYYAAGNNATTGTLEVSTTDITPDRNIINTGLSCFTAADTNLTSAAASQFTTTGATTAGLITTMESIDRACVATIYFAAGNISGGKYRMYKK